jgi:hypothetical protein
MIKLKLNQMIHGKAYFNQRHHGRGQIESYDSWYFKNIMAKLKFNEMTCGKLQLAFKNYGKVEIK